MEQLAVYGALDEEITYAEIFVYSEERSEVLLVEFVSDETQTEDMSEGVTETVSEDGTEVSTEAVSEDETESSTEAVSEEVTEPVSESELYLEVMEEVVAEVMPLAASPSDIQNSYSAAGKNLAESAEKYTPAVQSINGEWQILGLARSGQTVDDELYGK